VTRLLFHVPYISSLRNVLQTGFLDSLLEREVALALVGPSQPAADRERLVNRWPGRVTFVPQEPLFPADLGTRLRRRWRLLLHGLSLELLRRENVTFRRQANRHHRAVRLVCRAPGLEPLLRRLYPHLDGVLPTSPRMLALARDLRPDVIAAVGCLADSIEVDVFRVARALRIPSVLVVHSWDNTAGRAAPAVAPDRWVVWGEEMATHVRHYYGVAPRAIEIAGPVQLGIYSDDHLARCDRAALLKDIGLDPAREVVLYAPTHMHLDYSDIPVLRLLLEYGRTRPDVQVWYRPHPHAREVPQTLAFAREHGVFVDPRYLAFFESGAYGRREMPGLDFYPHMLNATDVMVSNASTISLEAAVVGRPIVIIGFDCPPDGTARPRLSLEENLQHPPLQPLLDQSAVIVTRRSQDFFASIDRARRIRETAPETIEDLRRCANRIALVSDGKVFERLTDALIAARRTG